MMKYIIYDLSLFALTIQVCKVYSQNPITLKISPLKEKAGESELKEEQNIDYDPSWLRDHPDREELIKNFKAWNECKYSKHSTQRECDELYEILVSPAQLIIDKMQHFKALVDIHRDCLDKRSQEECSVEHSDKIRIIEEIKTEMYPWTTIYETCIAAAPHDFCAHHIKFLHLPEYRLMKPESLIEMMRLVICGRSNRPFEECLVGYTAIRIGNDEEKLEQKRSEDEL